MVGSLISSLMFALILVVNIRLLMANYTFDYCQMHSFPACHNKPHIFCRSRLGPQLHPTLVLAILDSLNEYRNLTRNEHSICNLGNIAWSSVLEKQAWIVLSRGHNHFCYITPDYKNVFNFRLALPSRSSNISIANQISESFKLLITSSRGNRSIFWMSSAYSTKIGCARVNDHITCLITGTQLEYFNQSFGYGNACLESSTLPNQSCNNELHFCLDHLVCQPKHRFENITPLVLDFTTKKFILNKLENEGKRIKWDYDLEYLAGKLVANNLSANDICFAQGLFPNMRAKHFDGVSYFTEHMSNVDQVWERNYIQNKVGCTAFHTNRNLTIVYNLYCLFDGHPRKDRNIFNRFIEYINTDKSVRWLSTVLVLLLFVCAIESIILCVLEIYLNSILKKLVCTKTACTNEPIYSSVD